MNHTVAGLLASAVLHGLLFTLNLPASSLSPLSLDIQRAPSSIEVSLMSTPRSARDEAPPQKTSRVKPLSGEIQARDFSKLRPRKIKSQTASPASLANPKTGAETKARPLTEKNKPPLYPKVARDRRYEGETLLEVEVLSHGKAGQVTILESSGYNVLDQAALKAVRQWQFTAAKAGFVPVTSKIKIPVIFRLKEAGV